MKTLNTILIVLLIGSCTNEKPRSIAREKADLLLEKIGKCTFNCRVSTTDILSSLDYYNSL